MTQALLPRIKEAAKANEQSCLCPPTSGQLIESLEDALGFSLPPLLRACFLEIGNGGFGPGYGVIGLPGGHKSDYGDLVGTYKQLRGDQESAGYEWPNAVLPFCEWGCNIFSCVDGDTLRVYTFEDFSLWPQEYDLDGFFELWLDGIDILACDTIDLERLHIRNPFTGRMTSVNRRKRD
ncbi:MAG: SMI1/KNR4 family protein [Planctomycetes bacterium]|nr:SMI1/KNR4 family protein [Planctomycetota bacterium]